MRLCIYIYLQLNCIYIDLPDAPGFQLCTLRCEYYEILINMQRIPINYSLKNIGIPSKDQYRRRLIEKVESVTQRMRWKAYFFLNKKTKATSNDNFGLPSKAFAPPVPQMKAFEDDLLKLTSNITFRKVDDPFLNQIKDDMKNIRTSNNVHVFADKSTNVYTTSVDNYNNYFKKMSPKGIKSRKKT